MFLASSVSVTNTLAEVCEALGADWADIIPVLRSDRRIGQYAYLNPGLGLSGGNLERDLATISGLAAEFGTDASIVDATFINSRHRRDWVLRALHSQVISQRTNPALAIWGLAYKADTSSTKNSPALGLIESTRPIPLHVYDPQAVLDPGPLPGVTQARTALEACRGAEALVVMTPWPEFATIDLAMVREAMDGRVIIDPLGTLDRTRCSELGFSYASLGSPVKPQSLPND